MTFVDICLYFILIVWLRFVNHFLNYYLLINLQCSSCCPAFALINAVSYSTAQTKLPWCLISLSVSISTQSAVGGLGCRGCCGGTTPLSSWVTTMTF